MVDGLSIREVSRVFGLHRDTVRKMLAYSVPPGYRRQNSPRRPKLEPYTGVIDRILEEDQRVVRKQRHTTKRIFQRLRDEYGFDGGYTTVKDYVREHRRQTQEMFVPLSHAPGHARCDFGEALVVIGGAERKAHCFVIDLPHSDGCFVKAYPAETTEAFLDGHTSAFAFLGGVTQSILYDNTKLAVARILGDGRRKRTQAFTELQSHYLFDDRFGRPGKGNDKGKVEGMVGYMRRNFLVPVPSFESFEVLNAHLEQRCLKRMDARLRGHTETIGQRMERDLEALLPLPAVAYDACEKQAGRVSSLSVVRYRTNDYSVPVAYGHRDVLVKGYVDRVVISCGSEVIARHHRSYQRDDFVFDPVHYLPLLEQKTAALDQAAPLQGWDLPEEFGTLRRVLDARNRYPAAGHATADVVAHMKALPRLPRCHSLFPAPNECHPTAPKARATARNKMIMRSSEFNVTGLSPDCATYLRGVDGSSPGITRPAPRRSAPAGWKASCRPRCRWLPPRRSSQ